MKIRKKHSIYTCITQSKYLGVSLTKEAQDWYTENYKALFKDINNDLNKWKGISSSWISTSP